MEQSTDQNSICAEIQKAKQDTKQCGFDDTVCALIEMGQTK